MCFITADRVARPAAVIGATHGHEVRLIWLLLIRWWANVQHLHHMLCGWQAGRSACPSCAPLGPPAWLPSAGGRNKDPGRLTALIRIHSGTKTPTPTMAQITPSG